MNPLTEEWIAKAEGDYNSLLRELRARKSPNYDGGCFHAQQCIEKYIKAVLHAHQQPFPKTHQLEKLIDLLPLDPTWAALRPKVIPLSAYAAEFRYPGIDADKAALKEAVVICREVRTHARHLLGLKTK